MEQKDSKPLRSGKKRHAHRTGTAAALAVLLALCLPAPVQAYAQGPILLDASVRADGGGITEESVQAGSGTIKDASVQPGGGIITEGGGQAGEGRQGTGTAPQEKPFPAAAVTENTAGKPFSVEGNGELADDAVDDGTKEFITVQTKDGQTFFLVIDRSSPSNNVYMLSLIDGDDLEGFLDGEPFPGTLPEGLDAAGAATEAADAAGLLAEPPQEKGNGILSYLAILGVIAAAIGGYYYFRHVKPEKEEREAASEHMEWQGGIPEAAESGKTEGAAAGGGSWLPSGGTAAEAGNMTDGEEAS